MLDMEDARHGGVSNSSYKVSLNLRDFKLNLAGLNMPHLPRDDGGDAVSSGTNAHNNKEAYEVLIYIHLPSRHRSVGSLRDNKQNPSACHPAY